MPLLDLFTHFDDALDWQLDDPFLVDELPSEAAEDRWPPMEISAA